MRVRPVFSARSQKVQVLVAALVPAVIVVLSITGFVWAQREVTVVVDGRTLHIKTHTSSVADLLDEAGIVVDSADVVTPALDAPLDSVSTILVRHSVPVLVNLGGNRVRLDIVGDTVADALVAVGADPSTSSQVTPALDTRLEPGMTIALPDVFMRVSRDETALPIPVKFEKDASLPKGAKRVVTTGRPGRVMRVYRVLVAGGSEGEPVLAATRVTASAIPRVVAVGTGGRSPSPSQAAAVPPPVEGTRMRVEATGYSPRQPDLDFTTATGAHAAYGVIAVDPDVIPLGTHVYIPGYGYAVASDTGGAIVGNRIDLCFDTVAQAMAWGRRDVTITVLD